jgi:hypothetical protein
MHVLRSGIWQGRYHAEERLDSRHRQATRRGGHDDRRQIRRREGEHPFHARRDLDDPSPPQTPRVDDPQERKREAVEGMRRIDDVDRLGR